MKAPAGIDIQLLAAGVPGTDDVVVVGCIVVVVVGPVEVVVVGTDEVVEVFGLGL